MTDDGDEFHHHGSSAFVGFWVFFVLFGCLILFCATVFCFGHYHHRRTGRFERFDTDGRRVETVRYEERDEYLDDDGGGTYHHHHHGGGGGLNYDI